MKKVLSIVLASALLLGLAGCGNQQMETDENGNEYSVKDEVYTVYPKELPYDIDFNGETLKLEDVRLYQWDEREGSYWYDLYVLAVFDMSELSGQNQYWLQSGDMTGEMYITCEDNELDNSLCKTLGCTPVEGDENTLIFAFEPDGTMFRYGFVGSDITLNLSFKEETGDYEEVVVSYTDTVPEDVPSDSEIMEDFNYELTFKIIGWSSKS